MKFQIENYLATEHKNLLEFWLGNTGLIDVCSLQDHADYIYARYLLGQPEFIHSSAVQTFKEKLIKVRKFSEKKDGEMLLPHLTAYLLGAVNILEIQGFSLRKDVLESYIFDLDSMIDLQTYLPKWPSKWSHHTWRVSHWIGGIPSILLSLALHDPKKRVNIDFVRKIMLGVDNVILNPCNGLMRAYKSNFIQYVFRLLYRLRHDPNHGDIGGLVHIHWINHVLRRDYVAAQLVLERSIEHFKVKPFLETQPYCLDFDYVQLIRTASEQLARECKELIQSRFKDYIKDIEHFFLNADLSNFNLHKLPGALASYHEANLYFDEKYINQLGVKSIDIIMDANWL